MGNKVLIIVSFLLCCRLFAQAEQNSVISNATSATVKAPSISPISYYETRNNSTRTGLIMNNIGMTIDYMSLPMVLNNNYVGGTVLSFVGSSTQFTGVLVSAIAAQRASKSAREEGLSKRKFIWIPFIGGAVCGFVNSVALQSYLQTGEQTSLPVVMAVLQDGFFLASVIHGKVSTTHLLEDVKRGPSVSISPSILKDGGGATVAIRF